MHAIQRFGRRSLWVAMSLTVLLSVAVPAHAQTSAAGAPPAGRTPILEGIGDAENATFSADGRLFVTGGENVYEILAEGDGYAARALYDGRCNFTGIAERNGYLYAACVEGTELTTLKPHLVGGSLAGTGPLKLEVIYDFAKNALPNGMAFDAAGRLFVTDFFPLVGKIVTLTLDPSDPLRVVREDVWRQGGTLVNGIKIYDGKVYITDGTSIRVIPITAQGGPGRVSTLATRFSVFDDLWVDERGIIAADFLGKQLVFYTLTGQLRSATAPVFETPSSITPGRGPLFPSGALVITEKGALNELTSRDGNRVSLYYR
jgi:hypothetical protein